VLHTEEVAWEPCIQEDPQYHFDGIADSIERAKAHIPGGRIDCLGGSAAGIYVNSYAMIASLFKAVKAGGRMPEARDIFYRIGERYGVPFEVANDGAMTALCGAMESGEHCVMGIAGGTSVAGGVTSSDGGITSCLDEFAFWPVDFRAEGAPVDPWAKDNDAAMYLSQQALPWLIKLAGLPIDTTIKEAEQLKALQAAMTTGDVKDRENACMVAETLSRYYGYAIPHYLSFYPDVTAVMLLGRMVSGEIGDLIVNGARDVLYHEFRDTYDRVTLYTPSGEQGRRHGQAIAAAGLVPDERLRF
jgi:hypothetical protein